ncbi:hypothetical protein [Novosphingobium sp. KN65.2]|uniref:hypothetical protein n=1 Tax=Novosphingobium sp. KN65.2 TaxID=1478134 RepID=UPI0012E2D57E|nr:hypothetical protein [Novosphingobium sp. KN65.2]
MIELDRYLGHYTALVGNRVEEPQRIGNDEPSGVRQLDQIFRMRGKAQNIQSIIGAASFASFGMRAETRGEEQEQYAFRQESVHAFSKLREGK